MMRNGIKDVETPAIDKRGSAENVTNAERNRGLVDKEVVTTKN